jgi:SSS family solute:Na+ symporter
VATLVVTGITGIVGPDVYIRVWCAKDNRTAKNVLYAVSIMIVFGAIMLALIGMCANVLNPGIEHEMAMPWMIRNLLPSGLAGLILVALMAAAISGAVPELVVCSSILANDVYKRVINKEADDKQLLKVSRRLTFAVGVCGMALAMVLPGFMDLTYHCYRIFDPAIAPITVAAFYSRKVSSKSAMLSMIVGAVTAVFCIIAFPESYLTWGDPVIVATIVSILTLVISSQFLKSDDPKRENDFVDYAQKQMALWKEEKKAFKQGKKEQTA